MSVREEFEQLIKQHGMVLDRTKRHFVYKHPDGRCFTTSSTPSDINAERQQLRSLRKFLGFKGYRKKQRNPERRDKQTNHGKPIVVFETSLAQASKTLKEQLAAHPLVQPKKEKRDTHKHLHHKPKVSAVAPEKSPYRGNDSLIEALRKALEK